MKISKGILYMLLSSLSFAVVNYFVKTFNGGNDLLPPVQHYSPEQLVFFRSVISLTLCVAIIKKRNYPLFGVNKKWLIIRGVFGATALTLFFYTIQNLPLSIATTIQYLSPIFTVLFAIKLVNEKVKPIQWLFFLISFSGILFISFGKSESNFEIDPFWIMIGLISALFSGVAYNAILKCKPTDHPINIVMYFPLIATPVMGIWSAFNWTTPIGIEWLYILIIGIFTQIAQIFMTKALHADAPSKVTPIKYLGAIYAILIGVFSFGEIPNSMAFFGIGLILTGVLLNSFLKMKKS